ncbi:hypothetical protein E2C01_071641 [Portunus trituberculatus]|uniref:Uncharacterized protein n=1 Tax=Portunus trituberculatus TaxID=210409 RepID=A0A5B7I4G1_PORTR|nr:hypothetical protein [Portunus trituberculatus]
MSDGSQGQAPTRRWQRWCKDVAFAPHTPYTTGDKDKREEEEEEEEEEEAPRAYLKTSRYDDNSLATVQLTHSPSSLTRPLPSTDIEGRSSGHALHTFLLSRPSLCNLEGGDGEAGTGRRATGEETFGSGQTDEMLTLLQEAANSRSVFIESEFAVQSHEEFTDAGCLKYNCKRGG